MRRFLVFLLVIALWLGVSSVAFASVWVNHRFDAAHTANNASEVIDPATLGLKWSKYVGNAFGSFWSLPVVSQGRFFVGVNDGQGKWLKAFRLSDGEELWRKAVATKYVPLGPVIAGPRVFIAGDEPVGHIDAYSARGTFLWTSAPTGSQYIIFDAPVVTGNLVYVTAGGTGGDIYAFKVADGTESWHQSVVNGQGGSPTVAGGRIFATYPGQYYAFNALTGTPIWHHDFGVSGGGGSTPTATTSIVYMIDRDWAVFPYPATIFAYNAATGSEVWRRTYPSAGSIPELALRPDALFIVDGVRMEALDPASGSLLWFFDPDTDLVYPPVIAGTLVFVASTSKTYAVDATTHLQG